MLAVVLWAVWGGTFVAIELGLRSSSPGALGLLRTVAAGAVAALVVLLRPSAELRVLREPEFLRRGALLGLTNVAGLVGFTHVAMTGAEAGFSAVVLYSQPLLVALVAHAAFSEALTLRRTAGLLAGWLGVAVVVSGSLVTGEVSVPTVVLLLCAAVSWTAGTLVFKTLPRDVPLWPLLLWQNAVGAVPLAVLALLGPVRVEWDAALALSLLVAGVGGGVAGFGLQFVLLRRGAASVVGSWIFAVPVVSTVLGIVLLGEDAEPTLLAGIVAVATGISLVNRPTRSRREEVRPRASGAGAR